MHGPIASCGGNDAPGGGVNRVEGVPMVVRHSHEGPSRKSSRRGKHRRARSGPIPKVPLPLKEDEPSGPDYPPPPPEASGEDF